MANEQVYKITVAERVRDLIRDVFGDDFKLYRVGDPIRIGQSNLPAIFVTETALEIAQDATGYDALIHSLTIQVVYNKKDEMGRPIEGNTLDTILDNIVYGRDPSTDEYAAKSVLGILRTNFTLDGMTIQQEVTTRKTLVIRTNSEEDTTAEATIEVEVHELQAVNNRE
jgi:hypothetical protein